jgi:hypothetical protein
VHSDFYYPKPIVGEYTTGEDYQSIKVLQSTWNEYMVPFDLPVLLFSSNDWNCFIV